MIELKHLRTLMALDESGTLAAAAKKQFVTQSALSHQIKELESRIESQIFIRKTSPISFTPKGLTLLKLARKILPEIRKAEGLLKKEGMINCQNITLAIECHSCVRWLFPVIQQFRSINPDSELYFSNKFQFNALEALETQKLDLVLTSDPIKSHNLIYKRLFDYEMRLIVAKDHWLADHNYIDPFQLKKETLLTYPVPLERLDIYRYFLKPQEISPKQIKQCDLTMMLFQKIACREGVAALPHWAINDGHGLNLTSVRLGKNGLKRPLFGAYLYQSGKKELIAALLEVLSKKKI